MNPTRANEKTLDWRVETVDETSSTNDLVSARAREGEASGFVIRAISQTEGRGRRGRSWFSPPESGLYFSALLRPGGESGVSSFLTLLLGVAAAQGLAEATGLRVGLKWPNDLRVRGKKIGGILCEYLNLPNQPPAIVAGLGINLTTQETDFPPNCANRRPRSFSREGGFPMRRVYSTFFLSASLSGTRNMNRAVSRPSGSSGSGCATIWARWCPSASRMRRFMERTTGLTKRAACCSKMRTAPPRE